MSRTDNTMPLRIQEQDGRRFRHDVGGSYEGIGKDANIAERKARQRVRLTLLRGEEPEPTRHRRNEKWQY
ncbi:MULTISPECIES: hypothetical protein [Nonomuraea]|uniref:Uncharacterized protein n=2 Tax=Nonomuraea TaxID=83681 RepID=A0ABW1BMN8_9ACTN|nr:MULTISPECIES: hypothetical protein [Nonomuraea]MDA0642992.1 hypothetical protein [Nonomuraea ferruginea]